MWAILPPMPIRRRGPLDLARFDHALTSDREVDIATVDLSRVTFIDAYGLVGVACYVAAAAGEGLSVKLLLPGPEEVRTYLARMHLLLRSSGIAWLAMPMVRL